MLLNREKNTVLETISMILIRSAIINNGKYSTRYLADSNQHYISEKKDLIE